MASIKFKITKGKRVTKAVLRGRTVHHITFITKIRFTVRVCNIVSHYCNYRNILLFIKFKASSTWTSCARCSYHHAWIVMRESLMCFLIYTLLSFSMFLFSQLTSLLLPERSYGTLILPIISKHLKTQKNWTPKYLSLPLTLNRKLAFK